MRIVISDPSKVNKFATVFRHLKDLVPDVNLELYGTYMYMQGMGSSHASLVELQLHKDWFEVYDVDQTEGHPEILGIHCEILFRTISCLEEGQKITMCMKPGDDRLAIDFTGSTEGKRSIKKSFKMPLINIETESVLVPEKEYEADIAIAPGQFSQLINQLSIFGEDLRINCNMETIDLISKGDHGKMTASIEDEDIVEYAIEEDTEVNLYCSLRQIQHMCSYAKISDILFINVSRGSPLKVLYPLDGGENPDADSGIEGRSFLRFFLAPKIEQ